MAFIRKVRTADFDPVRQAADLMKPKVQKAFLTAVKSIKDKVRLNQLAEAISKGNVGRVMEILNLDMAFADAAKGIGINPNDTSFIEAIEETYRKGTEAAMQKLPRKTGAAISFDLLNPRSVDFLRAYEFDLIREVNRQTIEGVRDVVLRAFQEGGHPYDQARKIRNFIGLTSRQEQTVARFRRALESGIPDDLRVALQRELRDHRFDPTLLRALSSQTRLPQARIDQMVDRYRERMLKFRAEMIARTETIRASGLGQHELWRQSIDQGLISPDVKRIWITARDERVCPWCGRLDGAIVGMRENFSMSANGRTYTTLTQPLHVKCRCAIKLEEKSLKASLGLAA